MGSTNHLTKQTAARCTAHAIYNAIEALRKQAPNWTPDDLWHSAQTFFGVDKVSDTKGTQLWRMLFVTRSQEQHLDIPKHVATDLTETDLADIAARRATAALGSNLHALAIIHAKKSFFGYWKIRVEDSNGSAPKWRGLWRYRLAPMDVSVIRKKP